ncbi:hypothetical protein LEP1GSC161_2061 [Leptospira santarosai str. CBC1416]|uniref:Uncharacterized protein n=1 Tax=Leptospira santarosai str. CBC1416 TaxID=1193059 RepID=M6VM10_9LEPT|nr:hypothetical protein LEP1GSC175_3436 [Leptospira santarosai str. HAI821]EMO56161.1 hypothetical protein LEP1GSC161_2061 [Leptospira santarosai str. CBC1416]
MDYTERSTGPESSFVRCRSFYFSPYEKLRKVCFPSFYGFYLYEIKKRIMKRLYSNIGMFGSDSKIATSFSFRDRPKTSAILPLFRVLICDPLVLWECFHRKLQR